MTTERFIEKSKSIHNNYYDYSKTVYMNPQTKVIVICPIHGEYEVFPYAHLQGRKCQKCLGRGLNREELINDFNKVHNFCYSYDNFVFVDKQTPSFITCPAHGDFQQAPYKHLIGQGCPECAKKSRNKDRKITFEEFIGRSNEIHDEKYIYPPQSLENLHNSVEIICPKHGKFKQIANDHLNGHGCPHCAALISKPEIEIVDFLQNNLKISNILTRNRTILKPQELDIYIPDHKIAIEYNGLRWHSTKFRKDTDYHLKKLENCLSKDVNLIQIFEDEFLFKKSLVFKALSAIFAEIPQKSADKQSKFKFSEVEESVAKEFIDQYSLKNFEKSTVYIGIFGKSELISLASFKKIENVWNFNNYGDKSEESYVENYSLLLKYFIENYKPSQLTALIDRRWHNDRLINVLVQNNFQFETNLPPQAYFITQEGHRNDISNYNVSNESIIYDCGNSKYVYKK